MAKIRPSAASALAATALLATGCGSGALLSSTSASGQPLSGAAAGHPPDPAPRAVPVPAPTGTPASPAAIQVIEGWSQALRRGDVPAAARFFGLPSVMINGLGAGGVAAVIRIRSEVQAEAANASLPCGARFISADQRGRYVNVLFALTGRPGPGGSTCGSGASQTARTNFLIQNGRIVQWIRAPDDPGDNGSPTAPRRSGSGAPVV